MISSSEGISDLLFAVGRPPIIEEHGVLQEFPIESETGALDATQIGQIAGHLMGDDERLRNEFTSYGSCDCSYALAGLARFRVNIFKQNGRQAIVMRKLQTEIPTLEQLGLPPIFKEMIKEKNGIIFVTGATGSGKTTTLAAMLNELNQSQEIHIVTLEDPIGYLHRHRRSLVNQREVGEDTKSFGNALKHVLRQDPDIILVGEMRDLETISVALTAAETGHLVLATLHTQDAAQTIDRIIDVFPPHQQQQVRVQLAGSLQGVVCQALCPTADGEGRVAACEVLFATPAIRNLIREAKTHQIYSMLQAGGKHGMVTMDMSLAKLATTHKISLDVAREYCANDEDLRRLMVA